jgi:hypothetical protein
VPRGLQDAESTVSAVRCGLTAAGLVVRETFGSGAAQTGQHLDTSLSLSSYDKSRDIREDIASHEYKYNRSAVSFRIIQASLRFKSSDLHSSILSRCADYFHCQTILIQHSL